MPRLKPEKQKHPVMVSLSKEGSRVSHEKESQAPRQKIAVTLVRQSQLEDFLSVNQNHVLALIEYGRPLPAFLDPNLLSFSVNMQQLQDPRLTEVWTSPLPISTHKGNGVHVAFNDEVAFGYVQWEGFDGTALEEVVNSVYSRFFETISALGFPHLFRLWNYFPAINREQKGLERYKRFCIGRHQAFSERYRDFKSFLPAASAVGTPSGPLQLCFLAGRSDPIHIENPRQISAYDYPLMYGPKSPSFARATMFSLSSWPYLFIAGTASIVGHATRHHDDCLKQTRETLLNLESLLDHAKKSIGEVLCGNPSLALLKIYIRHEKDIEIIKRIIRDSFDHHVPTLYLSGEMCRRNLGVEIEALYAGQPSS